MNLRKKQNQIQQQQKRWERQKQIIQQEIDLKKQKKDFYTQNKENKKKISTSKKIILFLFINCSLIEIFTGIITIMDLQIAAQTGSMVDFTPIVTLIGAVVSEIIGFAIYAVKATKENTIGGIVYQSQLNNYNQQPDYNTENNMI